MECTWRHRWLALLGTIPYHFMPVKKDVIETNLKLVYGSELLRRDVKQYTKVVYGNLLSLASGVLRNSLRSQRKRANAIRVENLTVVDQALQQGRGVLWLACHLGNWEVGLVNLLAQVPSLQGRTTVIRKDLQPEWFHAYVMKRYLKAGIDVLPPDANCLKKVLKKLRNNEAVIFVMDQHTSVEAATQVSFLDHPVYLSKGLARVAMQTRAPVIPIFTWRDQGGAEVCHFGAPISVVEGQDREDSIQQTTQAYCRALEEKILQYPEQWFGWIHRLWKAANVYG